MSDTNGNKKRCSWVNLKNPLYVEYHDKEWGVPLHSDQKLFELLILEGFQAGLSWECILNKRQSFRQAFDDFDAEKISRYDEEKCARLMENQAIIRNRLKIKAAVTNSRIFLEIQKEYAFTISIPAPEYAPYYGMNETSVTFSVIREDYEKVNSGTFHSELLAMSSNKVSLEYSEILDKYRIVSPWGRNSGDIIFAWDGESEEVTFEEDDMFYIEQITDSMSGSVYAAYAQPEEAAYDPSDKTFTFNFWYAIPSAGEYAGFGYSEDTFTLDK